MLDDAVEDCVVKYSIFPNFENSSDSSQTTELEEVLNDCFVKLSVFLTSYIWQNESFNLKAVTESHGIPAHLQGTTNYGDNIEDEWFIVFMLHQLSKSNPNLVFKIEDSDGEFLLIEAADFLPKWINPETSKNRVFIYDGELHIIPIAQSPAEVTALPCGTPDLTNAVAAIRNHPTVTRATPEIQRAVQNRISEYPDKSKTLQHKAQCYVPASVATLLNHKPQLVATAVKAFFHRDPIDMKTLRAMKYFPPETRVMTLVTFTRCLYAQLVQPKFEPDRRVGWNLPPANSPHYQAHSLGVKLACGLEIVTAGAKRTEILTENDDFESDVRWTKFINSLKDKGYFKGELEGSRLYTSLLSEAKNFFFSSIKGEKCESRSSMEGNMVLALIQSIDVDYEALMQAEKVIPPSDDDGWLELTPDQLESILEDYAASGAAKTSQNGIHEKEIASSITSGLKSFLEHTSGLDGAEVPKRKSNKKTVPDVTFEAENFTEAVRSILDFKTPESDGESSSSMSGYSDEEEEELRVPIRPPRRKDLASKQQDVNDMKSYMNQMDRELAATDVGLSFERDSMENGKHEKSIDSSADNIDQETDDFRPVNIDLTVLKNILESFSSQQGLPGPASNLLQSMGITLPDNTD